MTRTVNGPAPAVCRARNERNCPGTLSDSDPAPLVSQVRVVREKPSVARHLEASIAAHRTVAAEGALGESRNGGNIPAPPDQRR